VNRKNKKIIVNFGDSIFGFGDGVCHNDPSISSHLGSLLGDAEIHNISFGGTRMSAHGEHWDSLSMYRLADAIANKDFTLQINSLNFFDYEGFVAPFRERMIKLINLDFEKVDIITIAHGANDYTSGKLPDDPQNPDNIDTYAGALRYSVRKITKAYPNIKIFICSQTYCYFEFDGVGYIDSDGRSFNKDFNTLPDFVNMAKAVAYEYKTPFIDLYHEAGINKHNCHFFFRHPDGVHHAEMGRLRLAEVISKYLF